MATWKIGRTNGQNGSTTTISTEAFGVWSIFRFSSYHHLLRAGASRASGPGCGSAQAWRRWRHMTRSEEVEEDCCDTIESQGRYTPWNLDSPQNCTPWKEAFPDIRPPKANGHYHPFAISSHGYWIPWSFLGIRFPKANGHYLPLDIILPEHFRTLFSPNSFRTLSSLNNFQTLSSLNNLWTLSSQKKFRTLSSPKKFRTLSSPKKFRTLSSPKKFLILSSPKKFRTLSSPKKFQAFSTWFFFHNFFYSFFSYIVSLKKFRYFFSKWFFGSRLSWRLGWFGQLAGSRF